MIKELLLSVDISNAESIQRVIQYLYQLMPPDPEAEAEFLAGDRALMDLDYAQGDPFTRQQLEMEI